MTEEKSKHCCSDMDYYADSLYRKEHDIIRYHPEDREYHFVLHGYDYGLETPFAYCPWCGSKLPESLSEEWCKVIKEKFGLDEVFAEEWEKLPEEFKTEEWWQKRGL